MTSAPVSYRPCVSTIPMTTSRLRSRSVRAASSIAYVLPTPGAMPKKTTSFPRLARRSASSTCRRSLVRIAATVAHGRRNSRLLRADDLRIELRRVADDRGLHVGEPLARGVTHRLGCGRAQALDVRRRKVPVTAEE